MKRAVDARSSSKKPNKNLPVLGSANREKMVDEANHSEDEREDPAEKKQIESFSERQRATTEKLSKKIKLNVFK